MKEAEILGNEYNPFLIEITDQIQQARIHAAQLVNKELTKLYWSIGERIVVAQKNMVGAKLLFVSYQKI